MGIMNQIKQGNYLFRLGRYNEAVESYQSAYEKYKSDQIKAVLDFNIRLAKSRLQNTTKDLEGPTGLFNVGDSVDIYISCWLRNKESVQDGMVLLYRALVALGNNVKFLTHSDVILNDKTIVSEKASFDLLDVSVVSSAKPISVPYMLERELLAVVRERLRYIGDFELYGNETELKRRISLTYGFWFFEFSKKRPRFVTVWGSTCPISRLHIYLCKIMGIAYIVIERGHFSRTISADTQGQFAHGGSQIVPDSVGFSEDKYCNIVNWIGMLNEVPYKSKNSQLGLSKSLALQKKSNVKVVLFIGSNDAGSGISYSDHEIFERHSKLFHSSSEAVIRVQKALQVIGSEHVLIAKPHPADRDSYEEFSNNGGVLAHNENINSLISVADVCVVLSTTAIAQCILEEKPIVTLALTDICGRGIAYECYDGSELVAKIRSALDLQNFSERVVKGKEFIQYIFEHRLFLTDMHGSLFNGIYKLARKIDHYGSHYPKLGDAFGEKTFLLSECKYRQFEVDGPTAVPSEFQAPVDVVIPVYCDPDITKLAIDSALSSIAYLDNSRLVIINDSSPDPDVAKLVRSYTGRGNVVVLENSHNIGFSGSVNRAIDFSEDRDIILFNSDAIVCGDAFLRMQRGAYSHGKIATVTPFSNNAAIFSVPLKGGALPALDVATYVADKDKKANVTNASNVIEVPVGHGFCMYIRRSVISKIGVFDEGLFGRGYSEEVDFCLRARKLGFINVAAPNVFVGHVGEVSFSSDSSPTRLRNRKIISSKYPGYFEEIKKFMKDDYLCLLRNFIN